MNDFQDNSRALERFVEQAGRLYTLPGVALQVLDLTARPEVDTRALKECIEHDPALTGKILRIVNSSLFGLQGQVSDLNQALALLGTKPLKLLVLGFSLPDTLTANIRGDMLGRYWWHVLHKAIAARELSEQFWHTPGDEAFIAGLLQDIGMLALIQNIGEPYIKFLERIWADGGDLLEAESESLGFNHFQLSARLLEHWGLPRNLVQAVKYPATPSRFAAAAERRGALADSSTSLEEILPLAELSAVLLTQQRSNVLQELLALVAESGRLTREQLAHLLQNLQAKVEQLAEVLSLKLPSGADYHALLVRAQEQLAAAADDVFLDLALQTAVGRGEAETLALWGETLALTTAMSNFMRGSSSSDQRASGKLPDRTSSAGFAARPALEPSSNVAIRPAKRNRASTTLAPGSCGVEDVLNIVSEMVAECRQARVPLSLLLATLDDFADLPFGHGPFDAERLARSFQSLCSRLDHPRVVCQAVSAGRVAVLLPGCDRSLAIQLGHQLMRAARKLVPEQQPESRSLAVSVGVATLDLPPRNFPPQELITAAERCLQNAQSGGGGSLKSIGVY